MSSVWPPGMAGDQGAAAARRCTYLWATRAPKRAGSLVVLRALAVAGHARGTDLRPKTQDVIYCPGGCSTEPERARGQGPRTAQTQNAVPNQVPAPSPALAER
jgi:hypothetical protein